MGVATPELSLLSNLQRSHKEVDVRVENHLRFEFAKPKAQRRLPAYCRPATHGIINHAPAISVVSHTGESTTTAAQGHNLSLAHGPSAYWATAEKREAYDDAERHDLSDHKRPRRLGSLAERAPKIPQLFWRLGISATSEDIGFDPVDDVDPLGVPRDSGRHHSHREESAADDDDLVDRRPVTRDAFQALEDKVRRHRHSAEHFAEVANRWVGDLESLKRFLH
ncbi:uncharacterized protein PHALS_09559 [Plasmopara halstedii]|uniref:Uncharacterized protein n=1 Tax=Plasmopara halstedii TaxID=4781 RepID=A0A0P1A4J0_PLAHL|nr:uncharacterized protein PHALS_09559 [Plasmopara halstedii]CEG35438.1 hypothetical protein PHALS_09559 [Plasmopara halstedii]|eukprot:XP_024571807.1 hypothetical protein PHALS_09559 [Plasmopara halstedii]